jgi:heavy-metal resistance protein
MKQTMKRNILTFAAVGAIALGGYAIAAGPGGHGHYGLSLDHLTQSLTLTADQQAKVQPILDAAKPQLQAIHQDAMQKAQTVIANANSQIRPLLTSGQQTKFDAMQKAHQDMANAMKEMHAAHATKAQ